MNAQLEPPPEQDLQHELHNLRTPLNQIIGFSEMLQEIAQEEGRHDLMDGLSAVCSAGIELTTLLADARLVSLGGETDSGYWPLVDAARSPISRVIGFADIILSEPPENPLQSYAPDIEKIRSAATQFFSMARNSRVVIRIEAARDWQTTNPSRAGGTPPQNSGRVLIVDDENLNREILCRRLIREGYTPTGVGSGQAALELLQKETCDIVLLDMMMPGMNGIEVLQALKTNPLLQHLPVLMLSALTDVDRVARCIELGAEDYLPKPVNAVLLRARLGACLEKKRLRDNDLEHMRRLDAEKELLAVTLQSLAEAVVTTDAAGRIVLFNTGAAKLTGCSTEAARGQSFDSIFPIVETTKNVPLENPALTVFQSGVVREIVSGLSLTTPLGEHHVAIHAAPIQEPDGGIIGTVIVVRDVTEQEKIAGEVLRSSKLESIGVLAGGLAHDFNNMLTAVIGNLSLVRYQADPNHPVSRCLDEAEQGAFRARDLAQYLLTFSEGGAPMKKPIEPALLLRETTEFVVRGSRVDCNFDLSPDLWKIEADSGQLTQAISHVVLNASQAMPDGGTIFLSAQNQILGGGNARNLPAGPYVFISVADTGPGIAPENLARIYDPFFTTRNQARGLGLAATYSIMHRHDGVVDVESEPGYGTRVSLILPAIEYQPESPTAETAPVVETNPDAVQSRKIHRVLLMDDEAAIREVCKNLLNLLDHEVVTTADGAEALHAFALAEKNGNPFDLIITDLTVPGGMGGAETIRRIREGGSQVRAIVSSGYSNGPVMSNPTEYGFNAVLPKPYRLNDLEAVLQKVAV